MGEVRLVKVTKYGLLVETLKSEILSGKYGPQNPFPSIRALIRRFRLSDSTVQKAIDELAAKGLVSRKQGRGTFVTGCGLSRTIGLIVPDHGRSEFFPATEVFLPIRLVVRDSTKKVSATKRAKKKGNRK